MLVSVSSFSSVDAAKQHARAEIDAASERARLRYISPGAGQALEYQQAQRDAEALMAGEIASSPYLQADVDAGIAQDQAEAAQVVIQTAAAWAVAGAQIRSVRLAAKASVDTAATTAEALSVMRSAISQLDAI
jgi:hypothetical protein